MSLPPAALTAAKMLINASGEAPLPEALLAEQRSFYNLLRTGDAQQLIRRFLEAAPGGVDSQAAPYK